MMLVFFILAWSESRGSKADNAGASNAGHTWEWSW